MKAGKERVVIKINGRRVKVRRGEFLLDVARREGIEVPSLCAFEGIRPYGACRLCLVKVGKGKSVRILTSCNYPVESGIEVLTEDEETLKIRRHVAALLLAAAPASDEVRRIAAGIGVLRTDLRSADPENRCILCGLCVRVCGEVTGAHAITFSGRGERRIVELPFGELDLMACTGCGACSFVCPDGCIDMESRKVRALRERWQRGERPCRYSLMGLLPGAICDNDYDCAGCSLDRRMFDLAHGTHPAFLLGR